MNKKRLNHQHKDTVIPPAKVLASAADGVIDLINKHHGDVDAIFGNASIKTDDLDDPYNELNLGQFCKLFEEAALRTGNDNFGLQFGANFLPKQLGAIGYAATSSPTLASAISNLEAYFPAHQGQSSFQIFQENDICWLTYKIFDERIENRRQDAELSIGVFINIFKHALGQNWSPLEIKFEHSRPDDPLEHEKVFRAPIEFNRRTNALAFRKEDLFTKMPEYDPYLYSVIKPFLISRCDMYGDPVDFAAMVRDQIKLNLNDVAPSLSEIANMLGMTERAFQKQLKNRNLTFNDLLRAARHELAIHYLNDPEVPLTEVSLRLGYSELSAFSRAFRAWTGMSPQRYRRLKSS